MLAETADDFARGYSMRKSLMASTMLLTAALALSGCVTNKTGDVGNKNLRPNSVSDYEKHKLPINGTHSFGSPTYRTRFANDSANERNRRMGRNSLSNNVVGPHENYRIEASDRIARQLTKMPEISSAYVVMSDSSAYVGVTEKRKPGMSAKSAAVNDALKNKISNRVKTMSPAIRNVYVSSSPDFVGRMRGYAAAAAKGHPIQEYLSEFNAMVARVFPVVHTVGSSASDGNYDTHRAYGPFGMKRTR